jgi:hypothetical protein
MAQGREKRKAGQHALEKGRKSALLWKLTRAGADVAGLKGVEKYAKQQERLAQKTWIAGGEAEVRVGEELERLAEHGFYVFHDVQLPRVGNVDHVALGRQGIFAVETKSHRCTVTREGGELLLNGRFPERDAVKQSWRGAYGVGEIVGHRVTPLLVFTNAFVQGRVLVRGVRVLPAKWLVGEVLKGGAALEPAVLKRAVSALSTATGYYPSSAPRRSLSGTPDNRQLPADDSIEKDRSARPWVHFSMFKSAP